MTDVTVAALEQQADRVITMPEVSAGGTTPKSLAAAIGALPRPDLLGSLRQRELVARALAIARPRAVLIVSLVALTVGALLLIPDNTAFLDEATYLAAGHVMWHNWLHGGPDMKYPTYFSGAPVIYPVIATVADWIGGLYAARVLSLIFMLITVGLVDGTTRRLFGSRAAGFAVVLFASVAGTQFLAAFATFDAMALMLLALAVWASVRTIDAKRDRPHAALYVGVPILALANATKYATGLYDPVVIAMVGLVYSRRYGWSIGARVAATFTAMLGVIFAALLSASGDRYVDGFNSTTLHRSPGLSTTQSILARSVNWVGALTAVCMIGLAVLGWQWWRERSRSSVGERPARSVADVATFALLALLTIAVLLAPIQQIRVHTAIALQKHVAFGAWFAAIAGGAFLAKFTGIRHADGDTTARRQARASASRRWAVAVAFVMTLAVVGRVQAIVLHHGWPNSRVLTSAIGPFVENHKRPILMEDYQVPEYYIGRDVDPRRWINPYYLRYVAPGTSHSLTGPEAFRAAIANDHFGMIALAFDTPGKIDHVIVAAIAANPHYKFFGRIVLPGAHGSQVFEIWRDKHLEKLPWV